MVCVYLSCLLLNKTYDLTSLQVRWTDCSHMWNGVRQVYLQTAVYWSKLWSLCRRIWLLPSVHPYDSLPFFTQIFHSNMPLIFESDESFHHLLSLDWRTWILLTTGLLQQPTAFKPCIVSLSGSYVNSQRLNDCCYLTGVTLVHIMSHRRARCTCAEVLLLCSALEASFIEPRHRPYLVIFQTRANRMFVKRLCVFC